MDKLILTILIACGVAAAALAVYFLFIAGENLATMIG